MSPKKLLIIISESPPGYKGEEFLTNELTFLRKYFDRILIIHHNDLLKKRKQLPDPDLYYFKYLPTIREKILFPIWLFHPAVFNEIIFLLKTYKLFPSPSRISSILGSLAVGSRLTKLLKLIAQSHSDYNPYVYSYWCNFIPVGLSMLKRSRPKFTCISRAHGYDVFFDRNSLKYLPLRHLIYKNLNKVYFISRSGFDYARAKTGNYPSMKLSYLGTLPQPVLNPENQNTKEIFTLVSCSSIVEVKRLNLLTDALAHWNTQRKIHWIHFGDGSGWEDLQMRINLLANNSLIQISLMGYVSNDQVLTFYQKNHVDLFINLSESEGIPYAMMEAISFGIPLMGTNVGGVKEIISHLENGILLPANPTAEFIAKQLMEFALISENKKRTFRESTIKVWNSRFNANENFDNFAKEISNL